MNITKLPSGSYRIRQNHEGKTYSCTIDHKPTKKEAMLIMSDLLQNHVPSSAPGTVKIYLERHILACEKDGRSVTTIKNYRSIIRNLSDEFLQKKFFNIDSKDVQKEVDRYGVNRSAKSVKNAYGLVSATFNRYRPEYRLVVKLPSVQRVEEYEPTTRDVKAILKEAAGTRYECALRLASIGLRRGEVLALNPSKDLDDHNILTINKSLALNEDNEYELKGTKTAASIRRITIPKDIADLIRGKESVFDGNPHTINETLHKFQDKLGIPRFRLHMLRHFAAAYLHKMGFTDMQIMYWMGWETFSTMHNVYNYNLDPDETQVKITASFDTLMSDTYLVTEIVTDSEKC